MLGLKSVLNLIFLERQPAPKSGELLQDEKEKESGEGKMLKEFSEVTNICKVCRHFSVVIGLLRMPISVHSCFIDPLSGSTRLFLK